MAPAVVKKPKRATESINSQLSLAVKSGKYTIGVRTAFKTLRKGNSMLLLLASNLPALRRIEMEYYAMLSKTPVFHYPANNVGLGKACGKLFSAGVISITDIGNSDILSYIGSA